MIKENMKAKFSWNSTTDTAFKSIKHAIINHVMAIPDLKLYYHLANKTSKRGTLRLLFQLREVTSRMKAINSIEH